MPNPHEDSIVPEPTSDAIERVADLPPADADDKAADVRGGSSASNVLKTRHDTVKNSISNIR